MEKTFKQRFLDKWNEVDEICPHCKNIKKKSVGITKQNVKKLIWDKPTFMDWFVFFVIVMNLFMAYAYNQDTSLCRNTLNNLDTICLDYNNQFIKQMRNETEIINITDLNRIYQSQINSSSSFTNDTTNKK